MPLSRNLGTLTSWNPLGHSRPLTGLLYFLLTYYYYYYYYYFYYYYFYYYYYYHYCGPRCYSG